MTGKYSEEPGVSLVDVPLGNSADITTDTSRRHTTAFADVKVAMGDYALEAQNSSKCLEIQSVRHRKHIASPSKNQIG
jgi:hypothetical protein